MKVRTIGSEWVRMPYLDHSYTHRADAIASAYSSNSSSSTDIHNTANTTNEFNNTGNTGSGGVEYIDDYQRRVSFPAFSLQRVAQHTDDHTAYCVCHSLTMVATSAGSGGRSDSGGGSGTIDMNSLSSTGSTPSSSYQYRAEGCCALPVGSHWLGLALACIDRLHGDVTRNFKDGVRLHSGQVCVVMCAVCDGMSTYICCQVRIVSYFFCSHLYAGILSVLHAGGAGCADPDVPGPVQSELHLQHHLLPLRHQWW